MKNNNLSLPAIAVLLISILFIPSITYGEGGGNNGGEGNGGSSSASSSTSGSSSTGNASTGGDNSGSFNGNGSNNSPVNSYSKGGGANGGDIAGGSSSAGSSTSGSSSTGGGNSGSSSTGNASTGGDNSGSFNGNGSNNSSVNSYSKSGGTQFLKPIEEKMNQIRSKLNGDNLKLANRYMSGSTLSGSTLQLRDGFLAQLHIIEQYMYKNHVGTGTVNPINFVSLSLEYKYMIYNNLADLEQNMNESQIKALNKYLTKLDIKYKNLTGSNAQLKYERLLSEILSYKDKIDNSTLSFDDKEGILNMLTYLENLFKGKIEDLKNL